MVIDISAAQDEFLTVDGVNYKLTKSGRLYVEKAPDYTNKDPRQKYRAHSKWETRKTDSRPAQRILAMFREARNDRLNQRPKI